MTTTLPQDAPILIVDDESFALSLATRIVSKLGYTRIDTASNGEMALHKIRKAEYPFQLILCDLNMPQMDGVEFMTRLKGMEFNGGIVLLSGEDQRVLETILGHVVAQDLNVLGAIAKPLMPDSLRNMLARYKHKGKPRQFKLEPPLTLDELKAGISGSSESYPYLVFQPKVNVVTGQISGVEALARWYHADRGNIGPGAFISLAEDSGLIDNLTRVLFKKAVEQTALWHQQGYYLSTSVNISINSFATLGLTDLIVETAEAANLHPSHLILEATETQVMENALNCTEALMRLRLKKFGLSIDDFGTGNSSMTQLMKIPFTELKIDRSFVHDASNNEGARAILEMSVALAQKLRMTIVAEGVETREDWDLVESAGCDYVQGFYCGRPMTSDQFQDFLQSWNGPH